MLIIVQQQFLNKILKWIGFLNRFQIFINKYISIDKLDS